MLVHVHSWPFVQALFDVPAKPNVLRLLGNPSSIITRGCLDDVAAELLSSPLVAELWEGMRTCHKALSSRLHQYQHPAFVCQYFNASAQVGMHDLRSITLFTSTG